MRGLRDAVSPNTNAMIIITSEEAMELHTPGGRMQPGRLQPGRMPGHHGFRPIYCQARPPIVDIRTTPPSTTQPLNHRGRRESRALNIAGTKPRSKPIDVVPMRNAVQKSLFETNRKFQDSHEQRNIRLIQRTIRRSSTDSFWSKTQCCLLSQFHIARAKSKRRN